MRTCIICRFETELDDVVVTCTSGGCICLRCFDRETGSSRWMSKALRRELTSTLELVDRAS